MTEEIMCSPRCGAGCTKRAHDRAQTEAVALAGCLGPGWAPVVWENLGWHYEAKRGVCRVMPSTGGDKVGGTRPSPVSFTAYFNSPAGQHISRARTPGDAVKQVIGAARLTIWGLKGDILGVVGS